MNTKQYVDTLWREFREAINKAYTIADKAQDADGICLRDYAENISWNDSMACLLGREIANERRHRSNRPSIPGFSNESAAKLILMQAASRVKEMPRATAFLVLRQLAVEAQVIGFLAKDQLTESWQAAVNALDYCDLMQAK